MRHAFLTTGYFSCKCHITAIQIHMISISNMTGYYVAQCPNSNPGGSKGFLQGQPSVILSCLYKKLVC